MSVNQVHLLGRCGQDPEIRTVGQNNVAKASFSICTGGKYKTHDGREMDDSTWHNIVAWRGNADVVERFVKKGTQVYIEGRLRTRSWDDQTGNKRYTTEIIVDNLQLLGKKSDNPGGQGGYQTPAQPQYGQQQTYNQPAYNPQPAAQNASAAAQNIMNDMPDDDLPF